MERLKRRRLRVPVARLRMYWHVFVDVLEVVSVARTHGRFYDEVVHLSVRLAPQCPGSRR